MGTYPYYVKNGDVPLLLVFSLCEKTSNRGTSHFNVMGYVPIFPGYNGAGFPATTGGSA